MFQKYTDHFKVRWLEASDNGEKYISSEDGPMEQGCCVCQFSTNIENLYVSREGQYICKDCLQELQDAVDEAFCILDQIKNTVDRGHLPEKYDFDGSHMDLQTAINKLLRFI